MLASLIVIKVILHLMKTFITSKTSRVISKNGRKKKNKFFYVYQEKKIIQKTFKIKSLYYSSFILHLIINFLAYIT